jgi:hypothetical protein
MIVLTDFFFFHLSLMMLSQNGSLHVQANARTLETKVQKQTSYALNPLGFGLATLSHSPLKALMSQFVSSEGVG